MEWQLIESGKAMGMTLEVCVDSFESLLTAQLAGADRIELCSALNLGGLTPSYGLMQQAIKVQNLEIVVMIRPRSGDFTYSEIEYETMKNEIKLAKEMGFHGIVIGFLKEDGTLDLERLKEVVELAKPLHVVLHRAYDVANRPEMDIPALIQMGICRILTSGQKAKAIEGADYIQGIQEKYGEHITIMPGSGVNAANIVDLIARTGCRHYHLSGRTRLNSPMGDSDEWYMEKVDYHKVRKVRLKLEESQ